jgi:hypothetical protein
MLNKPIDSITEADLRTLIANPTPEGKQLEYKRELPDNSDSGKVKFLRSVTALANTQGGNLIYGMNAEDGIPKQLAVLSGQSVDQILQRLESLCADGIEPRLLGVQYRFVPLAAGGHVLIIRVAKSWSAPHRVTSGGHSHFYGRNAAGTYPLDVAELRQAFTLGSSAAERIRNFRAGRLLSVGSGETPVRLSEGARLVLHIVPLQSFTSEVKVDISSANDALRNFEPMGKASGWNSGLNLDGRFTYQVGKDMESSGGYTLVFRNGVIEAVSVIPIRNGEKSIPSTWYEKSTISAAQNYFSALASMGITTPAYVFLSFSGVTGYRLAVDRTRLFEEKQQVDRDSLVLPEVMIENWTESPATALQPVFDMIWNAFGYEFSFNYNKDDQWVG